MKNRLRIAIINSMEKYAEVIVDIANSNVDRVFDYRIPDAMAAERGCRVRVPFNRKITEGCIIRIKDSTDCPADKLRDIESLMDDGPIITEEQLQLAEYVRKEYRTTLAFALRFMFPAHMRGQRIHDRMMRMAALSEDADIDALKRGCYTKDGSKVKAKNKLAVLERLVEGAAPLRVLDHGAVKSLAEGGHVTVYDVDDFRIPYRTVLPEKHTVALTEAQQLAVDTISARMEEGKKKTILLHGVTGSGKTEVYIRAIDRALSMGKGVIVLVPEISLTPQLFAQFAACFPDKVAVFHSGLSAGERYDEWRRVRSGDAQIVLGARSATFMPVENLGLIIIDEEHEQSYKADNHPPYHAADIARMRSSLTESVLVLASATPRIESYMKAKLGIYELVSMPERVRGLMLPEMQIVDMRSEILRGNKSVISGALYNALKETLEKGEQALLFLNRRGFSASVQCTACGHVQMCTHCDVPLKYHKTQNAMMCHYCGRSFAFSKVCPACGKPFVKMVGVGTELVEQQVKELFPEARVLRMDFDTTRAKDAHQNIYTAFKNHEADILIGTQMIARGLDFDDVTLAAVISADTMLSYGDFRAEERTFSMIEQVGGRAGRKKKGRVIVQTYNPQHYAIRYAAEHDYCGMYEREISERRVSGKPPYSQLFRMLFAHESEQKTKQACREMEAEIRELALQYEEDVLLFVAKPAPMVRLDGRTRYHILLKVIRNKRTKDIKQKLYDIWEKHTGKGVQISFDVDPNDVN